LENATIIWAAIITSLVSLLVAIISLVGGRINDRKKLGDLIRNQEIQNKLSALHRAIELVQNVKNELWNILNHIQGQEESNPRKIHEEIRSVVRDYKLMYSTQLGYLDKEIGVVLHETMHFLNRLRMELETQMKDGNKEKKKKKRLEQDIVDFRATLTRTQEQFREMRSNIIKGV